MLKMMDSMKRSPENIAFQSLIDMGLSLMDERDYDDEDDMMMTSITVRSTELHRRILCGMAPRKDRINPTMMTGYSLGWT